MIETNLLIIVLLTLILINYYCKINRIFAKTKHLKIESNIYDADSSKQHINY